MKEHFAVDQANEFVRETEEKIWLGLHQHMEDSSHRSITCGCPNCNREAIGAEVAFSKEAVRVFGTSNPVDHEEDFINGYGYFDSPDIPESGDIYAGE